MNRDLFREIATKYLHYKTCKSLSLAFKDGNVLSKNEKLHKFCISQGIEYCISKGYYDGFLEKYRAINFKSRRRKITPGKLLELARDNSQIIIFDFLWNQHKSKAFWTSVYTYQFVNNMLIRSDLNFVKYYYHLGVTQYGFSTHHYRSLTTPEHLDFEKYDFLHHLNGGTGKYVIFNDCLRDRKFKWFNRLIKRDVPLSVVAKAYLKYLLYLAKEYAPMILGLCLLLCILSLFILYQLIFSYRYHITLVPSIAFWVYVHILATHPASRDFADKYPPIVIGVPIFLALSPIFIACVYYFA